MGSIRFRLYEDDVAEIVFTSGTTAEPKGVIVTHRNLAAQLAPIDAQFAPYRKYVRPFAPLRILNLLPMSHLFGQSLATFVPPLIPASVVFISSTSPHEIARQIRRRRVTILVSVPKVLEVLRDMVVHRFPETVAAAQAARSMAAPMVAVSRGAPDVRMEVLLPGLGWRAAGGRT